MGKIFIEKIKKMEEQTVQVAKIRPPRKISPFWLLPIVAFAIGCLLFFQILKEQGQTITIRFNEGDGITAGKTAIRYQGLQIGLVKKVYFVDNLKKVQVEAEINPEAKSVLKEGTIFWVVKPTASLAGVSGLDTLVSGNYITLKPSTDPEAKSKDEFIAEDEAPVAIATDGALLVRLISDDLGSITAGAQIYYRKAPVGQVADYRFSADHKKVEIDVLINKKYASLVKKDSRFWNISGIDVKAGLSGVDISVDSLASVVVGAVSFDSPDNSEAAEQGQTFSLYKDLKSALRGVEVKVAVPIADNLKVNETPVFYKNVQVGVLSNLDMPRDDDNEFFKGIGRKGMLKGTLLIDPNHSDLLKDGTAILLREPKFSLNKEQISKIGELFRGIYFDILAGQGEEKLSFTVQKEADFLLSLPNILALTLTAPESYGVEEGQGIYYNDIQIGEVLKRQLSIDNVSFKAMIYPPYRALISENSKFVAISNLDISVGLDGVRVKAGSPNDWIKGGVRLIADKQQNGKAKSSYPLYKDMDSAQAGITSSEKKATVILSAKTLEGIDKGSVVLYRDFQVGEILNVYPQKNGFDVELYIEPAYRHLMSEKSRFWIEPAIAAELSLKGLTVQSSPLMRTLKGAISFDNEGKGSKTLYASKEQATAGYTYITLIAKDASKLFKGMDIRYMGLTVGKVEKLELQNAKKQIKVTAYLDGQYYSLLAKTGSKFSAISPEITTSGIKNIDAMLQTYINVEAGSGKAQTRFNLSDTATTQTTYANGYPIIVETSDARGIEPEAPVLYRGMQVGIVKKLNLSELGDRVLIHLSIENKYQHLVRNNTEFWAASGYTMDVSLQGVSMNSGTMSQLLKGGIEFSTPSGRVVQPQAKPNRHFLLQRKIPQDAPAWDQGIAE